MGRSEQLINIEDVRRLARRRLPRAVYEFVSGGAEDEVTLRANRIGFAGISFRPRALVGVETRDTSVELFGDRIAMPVLLDPAGLARIVRREGELAVARAAHAANVIYTLSIGSSYSIEEVAKASAGPLWAQIYMWRDRDLIASITERARLAGYRALCVTIDVPVHGNRERDRRNGMTIPPRITARNFWDAAWRLRWLRDQLIGERFTFANLTGVAPGGSAVDIGTYQERELYKPGSDWSDIAWLREIWNGPLLIKGIMSADDARRALDHGVNGLVISNHGGRQLDGLPGTIDVLPRISAAVRGQLAILLDGGIRRGSDVVKAIALGAAACMIGRPYLWGLAADGEAGVTRVLEIFRQEIDRTMALMGCPRVSDLDPSVLERFPA